jgi:hypothetical protein
LTTFHKKFSALIKLIIPLSFILTSQSAIGDEALLKVYGGGLQLHDGTSATIRMEKETVKIYLHEKTYTVDATFDFYNNGNTITVNVGFPKSGHGYVSPEFKGPVNFINFMTWVNGERVSVKERPGNVLLNGQKLNQSQIDNLRTGQLSGWLEETRWLVKQVTFKGKAKTNTRVKYDAPYDPRQGRGIYIYGTGRSWSGTIGSARFVVVASPKMAFHSGTFSEDGNPKTAQHDMFKRINEFEYQCVLTDIKPQENALLEFAAFPRENDWDGPDYRVLPIERKQLEILSLKELNLLRNWIYATHGKIFTDPELDKHFRKQTWYTPSTKYRESDLSKLDIDNIAAITTYETELQKMLRRKNE